MNKILFNIPIHKKKYSDNVKKLLNQNVIDLKLHGPGKNIIKIKKKTKETISI